MKKKFQCKQGTNYLPLSSSDFWISSFMTYVTGLLRHHQWRFLFSFSLLLLLFVINRNWWTTKKEISHCTYTRIRLVFSSPLLLYSTDKHAFSNLLVRQSTSYTSSFIVAHNLMWAVKRRTGKKKNDVYEKRFALLTPI